MTRPCSRCGGDTRMTTRAAGRGAYCPACEAWTPIKTAQVGGGLIVLDDDQLDIFDTLEAGQ